VNTWGQTIHELMVRRGLSQTDLMRRSGVSRGAIHALLKDANQPRAQTLADVLIALAELDRLTPTELALVSGLWKRPAADLAWINERAAPDRMSPAEAMLQRAVTELLEFADAEQAARLIREMASTMRSQRHAMARGVEPGAPNRRRFRVIHPPRQGEIEGTIIEGEYVDYEVPEDAPDQRGEAGTADDTKKGGA
jgi:transcriptional regulator with XRE-family HTH domain